MLSVREADAGMHQDNGCYQTSQNYQTDEPNDDFLSHGVTSMN
jgi:hypothetical protein